MENGDHFLRLKEIRQRIGLSQSTIYRMMKEGTFPPNVSLGPKTSVWLASEVEAWISSRQPAEREAWSPPPSPTRRVGEKKPPPLVPNEKGAEAAAKIAGVVGIAIPGGEVPSDQDIALRFPDWPELMGTADGSCVSGSFGIGIYPRGLSRNFAIPDRAWRPAILE